MESTELNVCTHAFARILSFKVRPSTLKDYLLVSFRLFQLEQGEWAHRRQLFAGVCFVLPKYYGRLQQMRHVNDLQRAIQYLRDDDLLASHSGGYYSLTGYGRRRSSWFNTEDLPAMCGLNMEQLYFSLAGSSVGPMRVELVYRRGRLHESRLFGVDQGSAKSLLSECEFWYPLDRSGAASQPTDQVWDMAVDNDFELAHNFDEKQ